MNNSTTVGASRAHHLYIGARSTGRYAKEKRSARRAERRAANAAAQLEDFTRRSARRMTERDVI